MIQSALTFPHEEPPPPGTLREVAPGVLWFRLALPFELNHVNVYLIEDHGGWAVLDTGIADAPTRAAWEAALAGPLAGARLTRLMVTHYHPDHLGLAGWLIERFGLGLQMSRTEYLFSQNLHHNPAALDSGISEAFYLRHGLSAEAMRAVTGRGHHYLRMTTGLPPSFQRLVAGQTLTVGGRVFEVFTGGGHAPEQVMLLCRADRLFFAADQVLARISPNISVWPMEPDADPLGEYLLSLDALARDVPDDVLVLAAHNLPFRGLHTRLGELAKHHAVRCARITEAIASGPRTTAELLPALFPRALDAHQMGFAFGEALAHVNHMLATGALRPLMETDGVSRVR